MRAMVGWLLLGGLAGAPHSAHAGCLTWTSYQDTVLHRLSGGSAYAFVVDAMTVDADDAPNAYHPDDRGGLDLLANAGFPDGAWRSVFVVDPADPAKPYVQPSGEFAGFHLSRTALQDEKKRITDPLGGWTPSMSITWSSPGDS